ncbi:class I adenylate-forming enzyme family protein [Actinomadura roseirufa]|uniref:class I adenylate-forming enzyme family protein n=1 Tax=Actinomadura roseirufa TaxID=2094049 RepID=UPI001041B99A|nr:fatty acid--CoA ligase family protein [Actinomadura roseirufa]
MTHPFLERMHGFGSSDAIVFDGTTYGYDDLLALTALWRRRLAAVGVEPGGVVALEGPYSADCCAAFLALIERGAIVVPLSDPPPGRRAEFHDIAQVEYVITVDGGRHGPARTGRRAAHELYGRLPAGGLVLFSSGTTGHSKASVLDLAKVLGRYGEPARPRRTLSFLNLDHIGGVNTLLHTLSQGGTVITVPDRTPDGVLAAIAAHRAEVLPTTPTFLTMLLVTGAVTRHDTSALRLVTYGTEPMPAATLRRITEAFPGVRFKQTYGLSELGILPTRSRGDATPWVKLGDAGFDHKIVDGVLWIRSDMAMLGYLNAPAPFDADGYFDTQDMVEVDGEWVRILGRRSEIINVGGEKVYPSEVESVLLEVPNVADAIARGRPSPVTGMVVEATVKLVEPEDERAVARRVREHCGRRLEPYKVPAVVGVSDADQHSGRFKKLRSAA